ncbi:MAG TPA: Amuc_1099 family pilus-like system protein [Verrucomicrobiales bacterium]|jgi:hypothetical protein|nr:Amuc_1099 family pilus-like system protein [Verrucomicrobiales bacterium]
MEWIKAKYDRLLLGVFGVIALLLGGFLLMKVMKFGSQFPKNVGPPTLRSDFGKGDQEARESINNAKTHLAEAVVVKPPVTAGIPVSLFTSAPVIKTIQQKVIAILDPKSEQVRPPIDNRWLYENDLRMEQKNIAEVDSDGDGYTNTEEFLAKTNPKDKNSNPGLATKLEYKECVKDPMTIRFNTWIADDDITFRRTEPAAMAFNTAHIRVGDSFPAERGGTDRFKVLKIIPPTAGKPRTAILDDLTTPKVDEYIAELHPGKPLEMPSRRAKIVCKLGKEEEKVVSEGEEFYFAVSPDDKFTVKTITDEEVTLEFTPPGAKEKTTKTFKIPPPP